MGGRNKGIDYLACWVNKVSFILFFYRGAWTQEQLLFLEDNTLMVEERERSVQHIFKSTMELNQLFRDVAQLVQEQVI